MKDGKESGVDPGPSSRFEMFIEEHPLAGLGVALCLGVILGWVIKRT
jgi:ElaB/YqjD/DUF883 family membrane-anchored ribosome-binding protein